MTETAPPTTLAELGPRAVAFLLDWVVSYGAMAAAFAAAGTVLGWISESLGSLFSLVAFVAYVAFWFWQVYEEGTTGQTIGKRLQAVRLVGADNGGAPVGFGPAFTRNVVNGLFGLGWLLALVDAQRQTLGDKVAKSVVVPA